MKSMLMFDLLTAKKLAVSQLVLGVVVSVVLAVSTQTALAIVPIATLMMSYSVGFTLVAFDERNNWDEFRLTLPLSRASIICGRYATFLIMTFIGLVFGLVLMGIVFALAQLMPTVPLLATLVVGLDWQLVVGVSVASIAGSLVLWLIALPLVARFGMTKAVRFLPLVFILGMLFVGPLLQNAGPAPQFLVDLITWAVTPAGTIGLSAAVVAAVAVLAAASCVLSVKLYQKREF
ncbi:ABC-2 transporter permease [Arabiibacter massiliensis]|uniref:ABC-2 transporter permease n=1 Tax=Arabiibacter massiliensis TaxID=1870985 RepID=UPI0009BA7671|nr:ABC-2 transporter permease [Arabiibacter massiliensis]